MIDMKWESKDENIHYFFIIKKVFDFLIVGPINLNDKIL